MSGQFPVGVAELHVQPLGGGRGRVLEAGAQFNRFIKEDANTVLGQKFMFAKRDKQDPSRSGQTSLATAGIDFTKPVLGPVMCQAFVAEPFPISAPSQRSRHGKMPRVFPTLEFLANVDPVNVIAAVVVSRSSPAHTCEGSRGG